jgi:hypothetical protein
VTLPGDIDTDEDGEEEEDDESDSPIEVGTTYHSFDKDFDMIDKHLVEMKFQRLPVSTGPLSDQITNYLIRPARIPLDLMPGEAPVRILVYSGHNSNERSRVSVGPRPELRYSWIELGKTLKRVPGHIIVVPVLACCYAGAAIDLMQDKIERFTAPIQLVMMASSEHNQRSYASSRYGDHCLGALFDALQSPNVHKSWHCWEGFMDLLNKKLVNNRNVHGEEWTMDPRHKQTPYFVRPECSENIVSRKS